MTAMEGIGGVIRKKAEQTRKPAAQKGHLPGIEMPEARTERYIHSQAHALAAEISAYFKDRKMFAAYLGVINRIGITQARAAFSAIKSGEGDIRNPRKFFMWLAKSAADGEKKVVNRVKTPPPGKQLTLFKRLAKKPGK